MKSDTYPQRAFDDTKYLHALASIIAGDMYVPRRSNVVSPLDGLSMKKRYLENEWESFSPKRRVREVLYLLKVEGHILENRSTTFYSGFPVDINKWLRESSMSAVREMLMAVDKDSLNSVLPLMGEDYPTEYLKLVKLIRQSIASKT